MAALAMSVVPAAAAQAAGAPRWKVGGSYLATGSSEGFTATSGQTRLGVPALGIYQKCQQSSTTGSIVGSGAGIAGATKEMVLTSSGCAWEGAEEVCTIPGGKIITNKLKGELVWLSAKGNEAGIRITPETSGQPFTTFANNGAECPLPRSMSYTGEMIGRIDPAGIESKALTVTFEEPKVNRYWTGTTPNRVEHTNSGLKFGSNPMIYTAVDSLKLISTRPVGVFEG